MAQGTGLPTTNPTSGMHRSLVPRGPQQRPTSRAALSPTLRTAHSPPQRHSRVCRATEEAAPLEETEEGWLWQLGTSKSKAAVAELRKERVRPKKSLGQNFLTDDKILANIVLASGIRAGDLVLEVGPGTGNLTRHLVASGAQVTAVEKDDYLVTKLQKEFESVSNLRLVHGDITRIDTNQLLQDMLSQERSSAAPSPNPAPASSATPAPPPPTSPGVRKLKVVANLPYNITKDFLSLMFPKADTVSELSIMIQEEVARRLVNRRPGGKDWRAMSVATHYYSRPKYRFRIPRAKYYPVPGVDGALVTFALREPAQRPVVPDEAGFFALVKKAFNQRRKMLRNSLQGLHSGEQVEAALASLGLGPETRAQDLTVEQFAAMACHLAAARDQEDESEAAQEGQLVAAGAE